MNQKSIDMFLVSVINTFRDYQKEWLTSHNDIEFEKIEEDMIIDFIDNTADTFIQEYTE